MDKETKQDLGLARERVFRVVAVLDCRVHNQRATLSCLEDQNKPEWKLILAGWMPLSPWLSLGHLRPDGIITEIPLKKRGLPQAVLQLPIVGLSWNSTRDGLYPCVVPDCAKSASLALDHLLGTGMEHLAFVGDSQNQFSAEWSRRFHENAHSRGYRISIRNEPLSQQESRTKEQTQRLVAWLRHLPKPVGVVAWDALTARILLDACVLAGVNVPGDAALVSAEENPLYCETSEIPISSIALDTEQMACRARDILLALMSGKEMGGPSIVPIPPKEIVIRKSSSMQAAHWLVSLAYNYIQDNISAPLHVDQIADQIGVSRRSLERVFSEHAGRTPYAEIIRLRLEQSKKLLTSTGQSVERIAQACGFSSSKQLFAHFKKAYGCAPSAYRQSR